MREIIQEVILGVLPIFLTWAGTAVSRSSRETREVATAITKLTSAVEHLTEDVKELKVIISGTGNSDGMSHRVVKLETAKQAEDMRRKGQIRDS